MAEVLATMVVGPLVSMVKDKASSILLDQYKVMEGMEEQHKLLKRKLPAVLDVITDAEEQAAKNREGAKAWLEELRNVAYKANDVLDEFKYEALRRKAKTEGHYKELGMDFIKLFPSHNRFVFRYRMANKLRMILQELDVLIAEMNTFRFKFKPQPTMSLKWRQTDPNIPDYFVDIANESRAKEKKEIVDALVDQSNNVGFKVLPIVGMGGMGKTTLAQLVYNDSIIQKHFQLRLWVCVSENFDVDSIAVRIVEEANKANASQVNGTTALDKLQNAISGKRYLLVLDDVWNREANKWNKLRSYLHHGAPGSSVLTSTRDQSVSQIMGTIEAHKIKGLDDTVIKEIIKKGAFGSTAEMPKEYEKLLGDIANRCKGSPLAATALGTILRTKNTLQEWEVVLSRNTICDEENGILPILKLSYNCLPPHMRQCFSFCAMFPKDHEIDVEMLIQLWMANSFIPEQKGVCTEVIGQQIFNELAQRSFFQEVKQIGYDTVMYCYRITCKIHDLMHDVAQDSMGKECAFLDTDLSQSDEFPYSAHHLFLSVNIPGNVLNASLEKESLAMQTLICDSSEIPKRLSEHCRSMRALKTRQGSFLEPKYLHHLRYLDLSGSDIEALPEHITILYHLQTLNLSNCRSLQQLPKTMKYMTALHHLYSDGCSELKSMPPGLRNLTSLQTLTCFVSGAGQSCCKMGELKNMDLGGQLELRKLENATGTDAKAAKLCDKKRLEELTFSWGINEGDKEAHKEVLEGLRPHHDGLKALRINFYESSAIPTWMLELQGMVELELQDCQSLEKLPALWKLQSLQFLHLRKLPNLHCLFSGGAPSKFQKLKMMILQQMPKFEMWWDRNEVQGEEQIFPEVENIRIVECEMLIGLPEASVIKQSSGRDGAECRSPFPALKGMWLRQLNKFHRWEAVQGSLGEQVTFPLLEQLKVSGCPELTTFPEAPKLSELSLSGCKQQVSLLAASRYITSLSEMYVSAMTSGSDYKEDENSTELVVVHEDKDKSPMGELYISCCDLFFSGSSALAVWKCFGQLATLKIEHCNALVYWPEKLFQGLVSLRTLEICECDKLTGLPGDEASREQSAFVQRSGTLPRLELPRLESLVIGHCKSLVQLPNLSSVSLKTLTINDCDSLKSVVLGDTRRVVVSGEGIVQAQPADTSSSSFIAAGSSSSKTRSEEASVSTAEVVRKPVSSTSRSNHCCFFPCLESLKINGCDGLTEATNLPPSIKTLKINGCCSLVRTTLSGEATSLEKVKTDNSACLESLFNGPHQVYASLRVMKIRNCDGIKQFPPSLQQRLHHLDEKDQDPCLLQEQVELDSKPESMSEGASAAVVLPKQSSSTGSNRCFFPYLEYLEIGSCNGLTEVDSLPPSIKTLEIWRCDSLVSLSGLGEVPSLERLYIHSCESLESLPNGPQVYSSLRVLVFINCSGIKQLPPSLQRRLDHLEKKILDRHLIQGTGRTAALMSKLECFRSRSED